jgi:hypothetical protein
MLTMNKKYKIFAVSLLLTIISIGCGKKFTRLEYSSDKKFVLTITTETKIPSVSYNVYGVVRQTSDNQCISKKVNLGEVDIPEDIMLKDRFSIQAWGNNKVIILYKSKFPKEIVFNPYYQKTHP